MKFRVKGIDTDGEIVKKTIEAEDEGKALEALDKEGITVDSLQKELSINFGSKIKNKELILLTNNMASMLELGLNIREVLNFIAEDSKGKLKEIVTDMAKGVTYGKSLSECFAEHKEFPAIMQSIIAVGEMTGKYEECFYSLSENFERQAELKKKVKSALTYPIGLLSLSLVAIVFVVTFALPSLLTSIQGFGATISPMTQALIDLSHFFKTSGVQTLIILVISITSIVVLIKKKYLREYHKLLFHIPAFNIVYRKIISTQFARTLLMLNTAGVQILQSLELISDTMSNTYVKEQIEIMRKAVINGETLGANMTKEVFDRAVITVMKTGEESGNADQSLKKIVTYLDKEVLESIEVVMKAVKPTLMIVMGSLVGAILTAVMSPMMDVYKTLG